MEKCRELENELPSFMRGFFSYLKSGVLPNTRMAYLFDIRFFCEYLVNETDLTSAEKPRDIKASEFARIKAGDINYYINDYCRHYRVEKETAVYIYENGNRSLSRKKSSLSVLFKYLYRDETIPNNITDGFDPIKLPKPGEREIKRLDIDEVKIMIDAVFEGNGLTKKEKEYWSKTKYRDTAILLLFITYGLRLYELQQLNISSFDFQKGEFKIYRKRGKESTMPLNKSVEKVIRDYIDLERPMDSLIADEYKDALFLSLQKRRITERAIRDLVKKYTSIAMSKGRDFGYSPHKLRATAATALIEEGNSIFDVQALLDHDNITTTQLYAAHKRNTKRELINNFEWLDEFEEDNIEKD
ncbi:MAG: tyrosine-type recombinase/integrase [Firmicutes bacterium]|nr:recombinase [Clostridiales bacterium]MBQ4339840.1 tyrosine-type recombinase/integrase [Bacillota bacterium]